MALNFLVIGGGRLGQSISTTFQLMDIESSILNKSSRWLTSQEDPKLVDLLANVDVIVWTARDAGLPLNPHNSEDLWVRFQDVIQKTSWKGKFVFMSSAGSVYGENFGEPHSESSTPNPLDNYGSLKLYHETQLLINSHESGFIPLILRLSNLFSLTPSDPGIIGATLKSMETKEPFKLIWGYQTRDFIHIDEVSKLTLELLKSNASGVFNVASGFSTSILDLIGQLENIYNQKSYYTIEEGFPVVRYSKISIEKLVSQIKRYPRTLSNTLFE